MTIFTGHCVMLPVPTPNESEPRIAWVKEVFEWLTRLEGDYDLLLVRNGAILNKGDILEGKIRGLTINEHMLFVFEDRKDAMLFHSHWVRSDAE